MAIPCVVVDRADGEQTRQTLADNQLLDDDHEIVVEDGKLYLPVTDPKQVPADYEIVHRQVPQRREPTTPADLLSFTPSYERIGDIAIIDEDDADRARELAAAIVESDLPIDRVLNRASKIKGDYRVRDWEQLAGSGTTTVHREYGFEYALDLAAVYFSPRLATERNRVTQQIDADEQVFDMFAGVGPFAIPAAARGATVVAVDKNPTAIEYLTDNAARNNVADRITAITADVRELADEYHDWADRIVMNLPHSAGQFLQTAVALAGDHCRIHYYDIQHEDSPFEPGKQAIEAAVGDAYSVAIANERIVRSYAPHEYNVCLDVDLQRR